jgi:hypothetical protein
MEINGHHQLLAYIDVNLLGKNINTIKKDKEVLLHASNKADPQANKEKTKYTVTCTAVTVART